MSAVIVETGAHAGMVESRDRFRLYHQLYLDEGQIDEVDLARARTGYVVDGFDFDRSG
jgi:hypothetical protein